MRITNVPAPSIRASVGHLHPLCTRSTLDQSSSGQPSLTGRASQTMVCLAELQGGVDQAHVAEGLREVADMLATRRVDLLGK